ncbi:ABC transporter ATP-binding protein [Nonomuraea soli]|uniref:Branched-chain amino acid transport system ATP-binding protein n=1 Tax=Nonomuraea soli TaxID=1032476 RepID=A0A7W0HPS5_9ACTN|nr:ATP-binding cassette domain-containing protein [Nonomuraea soli]MBA2890891.1 branched-chain amino acid transport system ATP-binding protein [Nonomuraea soli]
MSGLRVSGLRAEYGAARVLHGVDLEVGEAEIAVLTGPNGAGKTTLLRALSGLVRARGTVTLDGVRLLGRRPEEIARLGVWHVTQEGGTFAPLTVRENLRVGARSGRHFAADLEWLFGYFPVLQAHLSQPAGTLSGGEQRLLAIGRALLARPRLLLLDEPLRGLAPRAEGVLFQAIHAINRHEGTMMIIVEHHVATALRIAHRSYVVESGKIADLRTRWRW